MMTNRQTNQRESAKKPIITDLSGRLQPQACDLEGAILGALMLEKNAFFTVCEILQPESFYDKANELIYSAIMELAKDRRPVDMITVTEQLRKRGELDAVGGPYYISQLTSKVASSTHIEYHARIVAQKAVARQLITLTCEVGQRAYDDTEDIDEVIEFMETKFTELSIKRSTGSVSIKMPDAVREALHKAAQTQKERNSGKVTGIPTGIHNLTREFRGGWKAPDLIILGGRPSMGKTQISLLFAKSAAEAGKHVFFVSLEMTTTQLVNRLFLEEEKINAYNLSTGQMSNDEWKALDIRAGEIYNLKMNIADSVQIQYLDSICSEARRLKRNGELDMMIIDYLGLIRTKQKFERRQLEIAHITRTLKSLAKELDIPIHLLSQLNRPEKGAKVRIPQLSDLRESGDIEQDADVVLFVHRQSYYETEGTKRNKPDGTGQIIISKYREGARNNFIDFYHDERFKKIWGNDENWENNNHKPVTGKGSSSHYCDGYEAF